MSSNEIPMFKEGDRVYFIANGREDSGTVIWQEGNSVNVKWELGGNCEEDYDITDIALIDSEYPSTFQPDGPAGVYDSSAEWFDK